MECATNYPPLADEEFLSGFDLLAILVPPKEDDKIYGKVEREHSSPTQ